MQNPSSAFFRIAASAIIADSPEPTAIMFFGFFANESVEDKCIDLSQAGVLL